MNKKFKYAIVFLILVILFTNITSVFANSSNPPKLETRSLNFAAGGMRSDQIRLLKDFFRARGYKNVPWGYHYDSRTHELVKLFQKEMGIHQTGRIEMYTLNRINEEIAKENYKIGPREPRVNYKGNMIIVNKSSNTLHHMRNGKVIKSYPVGIGNPPSTTPSGKHKIVVKNVNPAWGGAGISSPIPGGHPNNPLGKRWIGISYGGGGLYGIHGNRNPNSIGKYVSLGCIRMFNKDVEELFPNVAIGNPVWIGTEDELMRYGVNFIHNYGTNTGVRPSPQVELAPIKISVDGEILTLNDKIVNKEGRTYYPFREIIEQIGGEVTWNQEAHTAVGKYNGNIIEFKINSNDYAINGNWAKLEEGQKTFISDNDRTYIPIRKAMEGLGISVNWDNDTRTILLELPDIVEETENIEETEEMYFDKEAEGIDEPIDEPIDKEEQNKEETIKEDSLDDSIENNNANAYNIIEIDEEEINQTNND